MAHSTILILDDHPVNLELAKLVLKLEGYDVHTVDDPLSFERVLSETNPDLVLMDIRLPGVDGLELTRRLRADSRFRDTVVVAFTAYAMKGDRESALAAGCNGYIVKPIDTRTFPAQVAAFLKTRSQPA